MTRSLLAALSHDGHARAFLAQPRREIALRAALILVETVAHSIDRRVDRGVRRSQRAGAR